MQAFLFLVYTFLWYDAENAYHLPSAISEQRTMVTLHKTEAHGPESFEEPDADVLYRAFYYHQFLGLKSLQ